MQMRQRDEEKRTKVWRVVLLGSTILIALIVGFFFVKLMMRNPLQGNWVSEQKGYYLHMDESDEIKDEVEVTVAIENVLVEVELDYAIDKAAKMITFKADADTYADALEDYKDRITIEALDERLADIVTAFDYSLERDRLILTEREYGEQFIFTRLK